MIYIIVIIIAAFVSGYGFGIQKLHKSHPYIVPSMWDAIVMYAGIGCGFGVPIWVGISIGSVWIGLGAFCAIVFGAGFVQAGIHRIRTGGVRKKAVEKKAAPAPATKPAVMSNGLDEILNDLDNLS